jgi:signal transduction histidine kinase
VNLGSIYSSQNKYADAKDCYLNGLNLGNGEPDYISSIIYNNLGNDEYSQGNYSKASEYYMKSIRISEKINDLDGLALSYNNLGNIYASGLKKPDKAIEYFSKSLEIEKKKNNPEGIAWELVSIGNIYTTQNKISEAEKSLTDALQIFTSSNNINGIAKSLEDLGALYNVTGNSKKAIETFSKCIAHVEKNEAQFNLASVYNNLGALYFYQKQYNKALPYYFKALNLANLANDKNMIKRIYSGLQDSYAQLGQFDKAYRYLKEYSALKDTLLDATISEQIIDIQEKYEKNKMEQKVTLQTLEIRNKSLQRNGIFAFLVLSIILFSSALYIIFQKRKNEKLLYEKNSKIKDQEIRNLVQESEIKSMLSMADGQENERQRISRELHDRVGSMLAVIKLNLSAYNQGNFPFVQENLSLIDNTYQEVRNISHNLHAGLLNQFGLKVALNDLKRSVESSHAINFNLTFHENLQVLPRETEVIIFRILQELITNVLKHASAKNLDLQINNSEDHACSITVEDDGNGFDPGKKEGIGLKNINYRLSSIGGSMEINSQPGKGTFILLEIPIFDEEKVPNK